MGLTLSNIMANRGFKVWGVEKNYKILKNLKAKKSHFYEPGLNKNLNNCMYHFYREGNQIDETSTAGKKFHCNSIFNINSKEHLLYDLLIDLINNRKYKENF